jgi:hypothetical protein
VRLDGENVVTDAGSPQKKTTGGRNQFLVLGCTRRPPLIKPGELVEQLEQLVRYSTAYSYQLPGHTFPASGPGGDGLPRLIVVKV